MNYRAMRTSSPDWLIQMAAACREANRRYGLRGGDFGLRDETATRRPKPVRAPGAPRSRKCCPAAVPVPCRSCPGADCCNRRDCLPAAWKGPDRGNQARRETGRGILRVRMARSLERYRAHGKVEGCSESPPTLSDGDEAVDHCERFRGLEAHSSEQGDRRPPPFVSRGVAWERLHFILSLRGERIRAPRCQLQGKDVEYAPISDPSPTLSKISVEARRKQGRSIGRLPDHSRFRTTGGVMKALRQNAPQSYTLKRLPRLLVRNAMMETPVRTNVVQSSARLSCHTC
jgi:hypothetical protein